MTKLRWGMVVLGLGVVMASLLPLYDRFFGRKRLRFPYLSRPIPAETYDSLAARPGWSKSELDVAPGIKLRGLVRAPSSVSAPWVLFYPGNDESQLERGQGFLSALGGDHDFGLALFPYRGYDASDGRSELAGIRADASEILAKLCAKYALQAHRVHLAGFSIGGHFAVHAARGAALRRQPAASLTLWAPVDDIVMYHASPWEKFTAGEDYQTRPFLAEVPAPVLVLQGSADSALEGPAQGHAIALALGSRARYQEFPGIDHVPLLAYEPALVAMRTFVREHAKSLSAE
jgi:pimeloyl-ACP methyl ester carboxylesterase